MISEHVYALQLQFDTLGVVYLNSDNNNSSHSYASNSPQLLQAEQAKSEKGLEMNQPTERKTATVNGVRVSFLTFAPLSFLFREQCYQKFLECTNAPRFKSIVSYGKKISTSPNMFVNRRSLACGTPQKLLIALFLKSKLEPKSKIELTPFTVLQSFFPSGDSSQTSLAPPTRVVKFDA